MSQVKPYDQTRPKTEQVAEMFNNISRRYDFLNRFLSMGIDQRWRRKLVRMIRPLPHRHILDIATGTADLAIAMSKLEAEKITGIDISEGMLGVGRKKIQQKGLSAIIELLYGNSENIPFGEENFDIVTAAFGVRNFDNPLHGLKEIRRVLRPGGSIFVLEFSKPRSFPVKQLYNFYFRNILPLWGKLISKDSAAYTYLPESVQAFPEGEAFLALMKEAGFCEVSSKRLTFGIASIYRGKK